MPGVGQVWLTKKELDALIVSASSKTTKVNDRIWEHLEPKLMAARDALGCPVTFDRKASGVDDH